MTILNGIPIEEAVKYIANGGYFLHLSEDDFQDYQSYLNKKATEELKTEPKLYVEESPCLFGE